MGREVSSETVGRTSKCHRDLRCLTCEAVPLCAVTRYIPRKVVFVENEGLRRCEYRMPFGYGFVCWCPVREELYTRYGV